MIEIPGLTLDEPTHQYQLHGRPLPSVTGILASSTIVDASHFTEESRIRGQHVHQAAHFFDDDDLDLDSVRPEIRPYLDAYIAFRRDTGFYPVLIEQRLHHSAGFAGTLDRVGWLNDRLIQLDLKSGGMPKSTGLQTAAYEMALEELVRDGVIKLERFPEARFALQLSAEGKYKLYPMEGQQDRYYFLGALAVHQFKEAV